MVAAEHGGGPIGVLREELRDLARARSPLDVSPEAMPTLAALAVERVGAGDVDGIHRLIAQANDALPRREARAVALLLADDDARWQRNLTERMTLAGNELGLRYDTFRRRSGSDRPDSHYDRLLVLLAECLVEASPSGPARAPDRPAPVVTATDGPGDAMQLRSGRAARWAVPVALGVALGVGAIALVVEAGRDDPAGPVAAAPTGTTAAGADTPSGDAATTGADPPPTADTPSASASEGPSASTTIEELESVPVAGCDVPLGGSMNPVALPEGVESLIAAAFDDTGGIDALGCPLATVEQWDRLWYQAFVGAALPGGRILVDPVEGVSVWIDETMFFHYERSGGGNLQSLGGLPVAADYEAAHPLVRLSGGGAMVAHYLGGPAFWVPVEAMAVWAELGGPDGALGLPMADVNFFDGRPGQHWSGGYGERRDDGTVTVELVSADETAAAVAALPRRRNGILRLYDQTAYWIDDSGQRRWIPDGETWTCLGGADALIEAESPGWVVGAFPPGPNAACP